MPPWFPEPANRGFAPLTKFPFHDKFKAVLATAQISPGSMWSRPLEPVQELNDTRDTQADLRYQDYSLRHLDATGQLFPDGNPVLHPCI